MKSNGTRERDFNVILERVGEKLTELRVKSGYKNRIDFAEEFGLAHIQYWRMEKGMANVTLKSLDRVCAIHGLTIEQLFASLPKTKIKARN